MAVVLLDPRFPAMFPIKAIPLLGTHVSYSEEVPISVQWAVADLGVHAVEEADLLLSTDPTNWQVIERLELGEEIIIAPSLLLEDDEIHGGGMGEESAGLAEAAFQTSLQQLKESVAEDEEEADTADTADTAEATEAGETPQQAAAGTPAPPAEPAETADPVAPAQPADSADSLPAHADNLPVKAPSQQVESPESEIARTADEHSIAVAVGHRLARTDVPPSVMEEIEDAVSLMARSVRQGEWEQGLTHRELIPYLLEETKELVNVILAIEAYQNGYWGGDGSEPVPTWLWQELCRELSDEFLQVLLHAELANQDGVFDIGHVAGSFLMKMRIRAPYLFGPSEHIITEEDQQVLWTQGKRAEQNAIREAVGPQYDEYLNFIANIKDYIAVTDKALAEELDTEPRTIPRG